MPLEEYGVDAMATLFGSNREWTNELPLEVVFADIDVEAEVSPSGGVTLTFAVKEKASIRKVLVAGNSEISELAISLNNLIERLQRRADT